MAVICEMVFVVQLKNPMIPPELRAQSPYINQVEMLPLLEQQLNVLEDNIHRENKVITQMQPAVKPSVSTMVSDSIKD